MKLIPILLSEGKSKKKMRADRKAAKKAGKLQQKPKPKGPIIPVTSFIVPDEIVEHINIHHGPDSKKSHFNFRFTKDKILDIFEYNEHLLKAIKREEQFDNRPSFAMHITIDSLKLKSGEPIYGFELVTSLEDLEKREEDERGIVVPEDKRVISEAEIGVRRRDGSEYFKKHKEVRTTLVSKNAFLTSTVSILLDKKNNDYTLRTLFPGPFSSFDPDYVLVTEFGYDPKKDDSSKEETPKDGSPKDVSPKEG